ncbi:FliM/FliN family flagellar motor switch protein [Acidimangrovimonas sediminis]|uniref:FliM/FliN family flagellar motor switch protein n=1 Tax=Acidimangrovimonas sediminis TaxID=2056283 RepID=UPI000C7FC9F8|nr:FliM/FliN family flagellar motor switch protein [Acidimangrovimonas sediminis]
MAETDKLKESRAGPGGAGPTVAGEPVLRRKAARQPAGGALPGVEAAALVGRAVRQAVARSVQAVPGLDLTVDGLSDDRRTLAELLELLPERALLAVVEGPVEGLGLVVLSQPVLTAIVEVQTMGRLAAEARPARKPTRTDAAMCAGLIDRVLAGLETLLSEAPDLTWAGGFRYASFLDNPRPLGLLLEDIPFRLFRASVTLGGSREGEILLALPAEGRGPGPARPAGDGDEAPGAEAAEAAAQAAFGAALSEAVMAAEAQLMGVLHRVRLPLGAVLGLKPGDLLPVPDTALDRIELQALDGRRLGGGRLGQNRGLRAVRLSRMPRQPGSPAEAEDLAPAQGGAHREIPAGLADPMPMANPLPGAPADPLADPLADLGGAGGLDDLPMAAPMSLDLPSGFGMSAFDEEEGGLPPLPMAGMGGG